MTLSLPPSRADGRNAHMITHTHARTHKACIYFSHKQKRTASDLHAAYVCKQSCRGVKVIYSNFVLLSRREEKKMRDKKTESKRKRRKKTKRMKDIAGRCYGSY